MRQPFISFYTPTYRRPAQLANCLESVRTQTLARDCEQVVIPDHVGLGVGGMFERVPAYAGALHGRYVHFLCDDDVLAHQQAVAQLKAVVAAEDEPDVVIVGSQKPGGMFPTRNAGPPELGGIDLGCFVVKRDLWTTYAGEYGRRYEGDFDFIDRLWQQDQALPEGKRARWAWHKELHFVTGAASRGRFEGQWP
jgi:hypothetical protein